MLYITNIWKNLVFSLLLSNNSFKMVYKSDKFILSNNEIFVENMYLYDGLFKMNVMIIITMNES